MTSEREMEPLVTSASPEGWAWNRLDASRPRRAIEHISHTEVTPVHVDVLGAEDSLPDSKWTMGMNVPIIVMDSLDAYWAIERVLNKLSGFSKTPELAKGDLLDKMGSHFNLLNRLESPKMAPMLRLELEFLRAVMRPR
jgi:hypothetical protein